MITNTIEKNYLNKLNKILLYFGSTINKLFIQNGGLIILWVRFRGFLKWVMATREKWRPSFLIHLITYRFFRPETVSLEYFVENLFFTGALFVLIVFSLNHQKHVTNISEKTLCMPILCTLSCRDYWTHTFIFFYIHVFISKYLHS